MRVRALFAVTQRQAESLGLHVFATLPLPPGPNMFSLLGAVTVGPRGHKGTVLILAGSTA